MIVIGALAILNLAAAPHIVLRLHVDRGWQRYNEAALLITMTNAGPADEYVFRHGSLLGPVELQLFSSEGRRVYLEQRQEDLPFIESLNFQPLGPGATVAIPAIWSEEFRDVKKNQTLTLRCRYRFNKSSLPAAADPAMAGPFYSGEVKVSLKPGQVLFGTVTQKHRRRKPKPVHRSRKRNA